MSDDDDNITPFPKKPKDKDDGLEGAPVVTPKPKPPKSGGGEIPVMVDVPLLTKWEHELQAKAQRTMTEAKWEQFEKMCAFHCTKEEIAGIFGFSASVLGAEILKRYGENFEKVRTRFLGMGNASLRRAQWQKAMNGDANMLKWLGQQHLGQSSKAENKTETNVSVSVSKEQRDAAVKGLIEDFADADIEIIDAEFVELPTNV